MCHLVEPYLFSHEDFSFIQCATVNRFTTLGTIPKTNYSSVLASTYDPYTLVHSHQPVHYRDVPANSL